MYLLAFIENIYGSRNVYTYIIRLTISGNPANTKPSANNSHYVPGQRFVFVMYESMYITCIIFCTCEYYTHVLRMFPVNNLLSIPFHSYLLCLQLTKKYSRSCLFPVCSCHENIPMTFPGIYFMREYNTNVLRMFPSIEVLGYICFACDVFNAVNV